MPLILAAIIVAKNPAQYGFEITPPKPSPTTRSRCRARSICGASPSGPASTIDEIQALNPELRRWTTPVKYPDYEVKVPVGHGREAARPGSPAPSSELGALNWYTVKMGETLTTIARKLRVNRVDLAEANSVGASARSAPGRTDHSARAGHAAGGPRRSAGPATVASRAMRRPASVAHGRRSIEPARSPIA